MINIDIQYDPAKPFISNVTAATILEPTANSAGVSFKDKLCSIELIIAINTNNYEAEQQCNSWTNRAKEPGKVINGIKTIVLSAKM